MGSHCTALGVEAKGCRPRRTLWLVTVPEPQMKGTSWVAGPQERPRGLQPPHPGHAPGPRAQRPHQQPQRERHGHLRPQGLSHTLLLSHTPPLGPVATGTWLGLKEEATGGTTLNTLPLVTMQTPFLFSSSEERRGKRQREQRKKEGARK